MSTLCLGAGEYRGGQLQDFLFEHVVQPLEESHNARHRYRREFLEEIGAREQYQLIGAANHSAGMVSWFVKDGIDDPPVQPLLNLYKTQVGQLADDLGMPASVRSQSTPFAGYAERRDC